MGRSTMPQAFESATKGRLELSPEELALRAQGGSMPAFAELVDRFEGRLYNFLLRRVGSPSDAEDLTQETFLRAWQRIGRYKPQWKFSTWLFTIGTRLAVSHARRRPSPAATVREDHPARPEPIEGGVQQIEGRSRIWALVDEALTADQQGVVWLRYVEGMVIKDIACVTGRTQVSVRVLLFRARALLAERLAAEPELLDQTPATGHGATVVRSSPRVSRGVRC